jgi:ATP-dependent exoDNAse (exonuclease V) beta subunit
MLRTELSAEAQAEGVARVTALLGRFVNGALGARFRAIEILARELPMLSAATRDDGPVGFLSGTIDMLYRDRGTGEIVVVDYKTDAVPTPEARDARAAAYAKQTDVYVRAVQSALGLPKPPRAELWFLSSGEIVAV